MYFLCEVSQQETFYGVELLEPRPTTNLEKRWTTFRLAPTIWPVWLGWPCQEPTLPPAQH